MPYQFAAVGRLFPARSRGLFYCPEATMKLTEEHLKDLIADASYHRLDGTTVTICALTLRSGFVVTGESACLDPANFDAETGEKIAYANAFEKLWQLEGYHVKALAALEGR
jgi:hypothetical protein